MIISSENPAVFCPLFIGSADCSDTWYTLNIMLMYTHKSGCSVTWKTASATFLYSSNLGRVNCIANSEIIFIFKVMNQGLKEISRYVHFN